MATRPSALINFIMPVKGVCLAERLLSCVGLASARYSHAMLIFSTELPYL